MVIRVRKSSSGGSARTKKPRNPQSRDLGKRSLPGEDDQGAQLVPSEQDWLFINDYMRHHNAVHAYFAAGFNGKSAATNAHKMFRKKVIQHYISKLTAEAERKAARAAAITKDKVIGDIEEARLAALGSYPPQCAAAIKASELHGKSIGMFTDDFRDREQAPLVSISVYNGEQTSVITMSGGREDGNVTLPTSRPLIESCRPQETITCPAPTDDIIMSDIEINDADLR